MPFLIRMTRKVPTLLGLGALLALGILSGPALAQQQPEVPAEFDTGDDYFPIHGYLQHTPDQPVANLFPGEGISGLTFRERPDGGEDWMAALNRLGISSVAIDWPGSGRTRPTLNRDYIRALKATVQGCYDTGRGTGAKLSIAHAEAAALLIKARSYDPWVSRTAVLIDPIGPQYSQPLEPMTLDQALAVRGDFPDQLWRRWGFGARAGELDPRLDINLATAMQLFEAYDRDAFQIRPAVLQPMISPVRVRGPGLLAGWRVLVVRTRGADAAQIKREEALTRWLEAAEVHVEHLDLTSDPVFATTTGLPWVGETAPLVIERCVEWFRTALPLTAEPAMPTRSAP